MLKDDFLLVEKNATFYKKKNTHTHKKKKDLLMLTTRIYIFKMHLNMAKLRSMNTSFLEKWHHLEYHQNKHLCINKAVKIKHYHTWIISENYFRDQWLLSFMFCYVSAKNKCWVWCQTLPTFQSYFTQS